jgi:GTP pyrophosphokinase
MNFVSADDLYTSVSYGGVLLNKVVSQLAEMYEAEKAKAATKLDDTNLIEQANKKKPLMRKEAQGNVRVAGVENLLIRLAKCCSPVPGDEIIGFITKGRGLTVHRKDCTNIVNLPEAERGRLMEVEWNIDNAGETYDAEIYIQSTDRKGLFSDISRRCVDMDVNISGVNLRTNSDNTVTILMTLSIANTNQMERVLRTLRQIESVTEVYRARVQ